MHKQRVRTLQALVAGLPAVSSSPVGSIVVAEFGEVYLTRKVRIRPRRRLLEIVHAARALDSALAQFVNYHGCKAPKQKKLPRNLGAYLIALERHSVPGLGTFAAAQTQSFQQNIVDVRNHYMHEAGAAPSTDTEAATLLAHMAACLTAVSRL